MCSPAVRGLTVILMAVGAVVIGGTTGAARVAAASSGSFGYNQGILEKEKPFTSVSGNFTVPLATQHTSGQAEESAVWIGLGGGCLNTSCVASDATLIQAGTEQDISASGQPSYYAWWDVFPAPSFAISSVSVHPGDQIHVAIAQVVPELWSIALSDLTSGQSFTDEVPYSSTMSTAEWMVNAPSTLGTGGTGFGALPNLGGAIQFDLAQVDGAPANLVPAEKVFGSGTPSDPDPDSDGFNDCPFAATCAAPTAS